MAQYRSLSYDSVVQDMFTATRCFSSGRLLSLSHVVQALLEVERGAVCRPFVELAGDHLAVPHHSGDELVVVAVCCGDPGDLRSMIVRHSYRVACRNTDGRGPPCRGKSCVDSVTVVDVSIPDSAKIVIRAFPGGHSS
jgi:hypothetical protein